MGCIFSKDYIEEPEDNYTNIIIWYKGHCCRSLPENRIRLGSEKEDVKLVPAKLVGKISQEEWTELYDNLLKETDDTFGGKGCCCMQYIPIVNCFTECFLRSTESKYEIQLQYICNEFNGKFSQKGLIMNWKTQNVDFGGQHSGIVGYKSIYYLKISWN
jgi:hypothetical protein